MSKSVYYLTGMGGRLHTGLGEALSSRGFELYGRELFGEFKKLQFQEQIDTVAHDLKTHFWHEDAFVIANSFGAYLFLHAQAQIDPYIGKVILLSPIIGEFSNEETMTAYVPPRADRIFELAKSNQFPKPSQCEIHVGELDWQSNSAKVTELGKLLNITTHIVPKAGHMIPKEYVGSLLDKIAPTQNNTEMGA
jgi:predicted alpha/beta hydrolase family esterase